MPLKVSEVANGQTVVKTSTVVVTQVSLVQAEAAAAKEAMTANFVNCILTDLGDIKIYLKSNRVMRLMKRCWKAI